MVSSLIVQPIVTVPASQALALDARRARSRELPYNTAPGVTCRTAHLEFVPGVDLMFHVLTTMKETVSSGHSQASSGRGDGITRLLSALRTLNSGENAEAAARRVTGVRRRGSWSSMRWISHFMSYRLRGG